MHFKASHLPLAFRWLFTICQRSSRVNTKRREQWACWVPRVENKKLKLTAPILISTHKQHTNEAHFIWMLVDSRSSLLFHLETLHCDDKFFAFIAKAKLNVELKCSYQAALLALNAVDGCCSYFDAMGNFATSLMSTGNIHKGITSLFSIIIALTPHKHTIYSSHYRVDSILTLTTANT